MRGVVPFAASGPMQRVGGPVVSNRSFAQGMIVRLLRLWCAATMDGRRPLPILIGAVVPLGLAAESGIAAASLFELVEESLGRPIRPECCCSRTLSADERAVLRLIDVAPVTLGRRGDAVIPHGLPAVVGWAAMAVRSALNMPAEEHRDPAYRERGCPFGSAAWPTQARSSTSPL